MNSNDANWFITGLTLALLVSTITRAEDQPALTNELRTPGAPPYTAWSASKPEDEAKLTTPLLRIPKLDRPPVIDGKIDPEEWKGATAVTAFPNYNLDMSLPQSLQPVWYVAYDDNYFYLAFHYPVYPKGSLRAVCKTKPEAEEQVAGKDILFEDHTEIEICNIGRDKAVSGYFFKFMTNPWDVVSDQKVRWSVGLPGYEYESGAVAKSVFTADAWDQEIAIPIKALDVKKIQDGDSWVMQLVSAQDAGGNYYTWVPATWLQFHRFPEILFDSKAVAVQFTGVGDWMNGNPDYTFKTFNPQKQDVTINLGVKMVASDGRVLLDRNDSVALKPGESREEHVKASGLVLGDKAARVYFDITDAATGAIYYRNDTSLWNAQSEDVKSYIKNLDVARKPVAPKLDFAYMPSFNRLDVSTDVGILGIDPKLPKAARYLSASFGKPGGELTGRNSMPFRADGTAELTFEFPQLPEGDYDINMEIQDADGKALVSKQGAFEQKVFPFQSYKGGLEETVVKPYTPIRTADQTFETVGNQIKLTDAGLVSGIRNKLVPAAAGQDILAAPMRLVATQDGKAVNLGAAQNGFAWTDSGLPTKATGSAESRLAGLTFKVTGDAEYTGQYLVNMDIVPNGKASLDRLELEIPINDPVDTCYVYSPRDSMLLYDKTHPWTGNPKEGELWNNLSDRATATRPYIMYVGNGERGLYWYTDSYEGFWLDRNQPHIFIEKRKGATVLRVAFINKPVVIDHPRHLRFAVIAVPCKPLPADARAMQWNSARMHIGITGWWGTVGCFTIPNNDQEWQDWIAGKPFTFNGHPAPGDFPLTPTPPRDATGRWLLEKGHEYACYRNDMIGYLQPEEKVFAGEWSGVSDLPISPDGSLLGYKDEQGNSIWPDPEQRTVEGRDTGLQSFYDFEAYHFYLMARNTGDGGYWWDWAGLTEGNSLEKGEMYLNDEGQPEPRSNLFLVRAFYHRIARIVQDLGIPDANNVYAPGVVFQMPWLTRICAIESLYLESDLDDMFDAWGVDRYRMQIGKYSGIPVQLCMNIPINFKDHRARTVLAMAFLHDNGVFAMDGDMAGMDIIRRAGLLDESAEWIPYWRSQKTAWAGQPGLLITAYRTSSPKGLTLVVVNPGPADVTTDITVPGGGKALDAETGAVISASGDKISNLTVKRHDFRLLTLE
ncbi:MAG TPA: glycoside hydrolase domain-containing protein [Candidatus Limnocylindrales bacterium]|nr:glycoside hydrolase domain-containing protein [Candidatus Limnocylindrales bacterium]